jgi:hypothetical protein
MNYAVALLELTELMMQDQQGPALPVEHGLSIKLYLCERLGDKARRINWLRMPTSIEQLLEVRRTIQKCTRWKDLDLQKYGPRVKVALAWLDLESAKLLRPRLEALLRRLPKEPPKQPQRLYAVPSQEEELPHAN